LYKIPEPETPETKCQKGKGKNSVKPKTYGETSKEKDKEV